jgi:hypothetical protein
LSLVAVRGEGDEDEEGEGEDRVGWGNLESQISNLKSPPRGPEILDGIVAQLHERLAAERGMTIFAVLYASSVQG